MAEEAFFLRVLSPLGPAFQGLARAATLPTAEGEITILANHMPMVAVLADGEVRIHTDKGEVSVAIAGGFLDSGGRGGGSQTDWPWEAVVLSDFAMQSDSIEIARVEEAKARAEQLLLERRERGELILVERDLQRAILQLKIAEKVRVRRRTT